MKNNINQFLSENDFDVFEPNAGHENRFLEKLHKPKKNYNLFWIGAVASVVFLFSFVVGMYYQNNINDLKDVSIEMAETQSFYNGSIYTMIKKIEKQKNSENKKLIEDSLVTINKLEISYKELQSELKKLDNQEYIIHNMIENYQQRIEVLKQLLEILNKKQLETQKKLNYEIS